MGPLLALGLLDYFHARRAVERIVASQTEASARRAAELIAERYAQVESDALLIGENSETTTLLQTLAHGDSAQLHHARAAADSFLQTKWRQSGNAYRSLELLDAHGTLITRLTSEPDSNATKLDTLPALHFAIRPEPTSPPLGEVILHPLTSTLLPSQLTGLAFGRAGYLLLADSAGQRVLHDSRNGQSGGTLPTLNNAEGEALTFAEGDSTRMAYALRIPGLNWTVLSAAALPEFTAGLNSARFIDLAVVIAIAALIALLFTILIGHSTRSLEELRTAAEAVGRGELAPPLPPVTDDEIGTLSGAFDQMLTRIRSMLREIEVSRQLAVLGQFSAQLSHEVRNPLTSLKLNLQGLSRDVRKGVIPEHAGPPLESCLREVNRLDSVVRGVLELARPRPADPRPCDVHRLLDEVIEVHAARLAEAGIVVVREQHDTSAMVIGDAAQLVSLFTNLVVNAIDAQPGGGRLVLSTEQRDGNVAITVADDGPGTPATLGDEIFRPFVSGKPTGTGLGLPMAMEVARDHHGTLQLVRPSPFSTGAAFRVTLPAA